MALNPNPIDANTSKHLVPFVVLTWGDPVKANAYVRWERDEVDVASHPGGPSGWVFRSAPELDVRLDKQDGGAGVVPARFQIAIDRGPFDKLCRPYAHATVRARLGEVDPLNWADTFRFDYDGRITRTVRNKFGNKRIVEAEVTGTKERLSYPVGLPCTLQCQHVLGDEGCRVDLSGHTFTGTCTGVSVRDFTVSGLPGGKPPQYFQFGSAYVDGLAILIGEELGPGSFRAAYKRPPPEWVGQPVVMTAGCDKRIDGDCRGVFNNEGRFLGLGIRMPAHNPLYENP